LLAVFVAIESQVQPPAQEVARLRYAAADAVRDEPRYRIGRARVVGARSLEEDAHVAPRREADAKCIRVRRRVDDLVELRGVEAILQADLRGVVCARERIADVARGPRPIGRRDHRLADHLAARGLGYARYEPRLGRIEAHRFVGNGVSLDDQRLRARAASIDDAPEYVAGDRRAVRHAGNRHLEP
jgi:hypothetical protein